MKIHNPVVAYVAESNSEAYIVADMLNGSGVTAHVIEDVSHSYAGNPRPKVWVDQASINEAAALLAEFDQQKRNRLKTDKTAPPIMSLCESCGAENEFPASQDGTTQNCPQCDAYMDVGEFDWPDEAQ